MSLGCHCGDGTRGKLRTSAALILDAASDGLASLVVSMCNCSGISSMIQLTKPALPWPVKPPGRNHESFSNHQSFCHVCTNVNPECAYSVFGLREDVKYDEHSGFRPALESGEPIPSWAGRPGASSRPDLGAWQVSATLSDIMAAAAAGCASCEVLKQGIIGVSRGDVSRVANNISVSIVYCKRNAMRVQYQPNHR